MKRKPVTLFCLGGLLSGGLGAACSDGEAVESDGSDRPVPGGEAIEDTSGVRDSVGQPSQGGDVGGTVVDDHYHAPGSEIIELDGSELPELPKNIGNRLFDTVVRLDENGRTQRKMIETTAEQRALTSKMAQDFEILLKNVQGKPSAVQIDRWRSSWGLPSKEESRQLLADLMSQPFDIMLTGELDESLRTEMESAGASGLDVMTNSQALAAYGYSYINAVGGGSSGGACAPYIWDHHSIVYWSGTDYTGNVLCLYNIWNTSTSTHTAYIHWTHSTYWPSGQDVDSYIFQLASLRGRDPDDTGSVVPGGELVWKWDSNSSGEFIDSCSGSCLDPIALTLNCW